MDKPQQIVPKKIILFLDEYKKSYLVYSNLNDLLKFNEPDDYLETPVTRLNDIKEKWVIKKVIYTKGKLTLEFKKLK